MNPINLIPTPNRIAEEFIAIALALASIFYAGWTYGSHHIQSKWDAATVKQNLMVQKSEEENRAKEQSLNQKIQEAQNAATEREKKLKADADAARSAANGLRDTIATLRSSLPTTTAETCRSIASTGLAVFSQCEDKYRAVAEVADQCISDVKMLEDAWPK